MESYFRSVYNTMVDTSISMQSFLCKFYIYFKSLVVIVIGLHKDKISDMFKDGLGS